MKKHYPKFDRRQHQAEALSLLAGLILCPLAGMATDSIYINNGAINNNNLPQIDATNFYNSGSWNINTDGSGTGSPYETSHTLNYTNTGTMIGTVGWEFDYGPLPIGGRGMSANFINNSAGASIQANYGPVFNPINGNQTFNVDYLWVSATNIVNKGTLQADAFGEIRLTGTNVNLSRSTVEIAPVPGLGSSNSRSNFLADIALYDEYWGQAETNLDSGATWDGANAVSSSLPVDVTNKCIGAVTPNGGFLSFTPTKADSISVVVGQMAVTVTNMSVITTNSVTTTNFVITTVMVTTNLIHQAVFVVTSDPNITAAIGFTPSANPTNFFSTATVQLSNSVSGGSLYLVDTLASDTGRGVLPNSVVSPLDECGAATFRPTNYIVMRTLFGSIGSPGQGPPPANFFYDPNWGVSSVVSSASYAAYSFLVDIGASGQPVQSDPSFTNAQGRVYINAGVLNLDHAQILQPAGPGVQGDGALFIQANQVLNSQNAIITFRNLSLNLGSTNGNLNVTNFATASSVNSGINGTASEWSAVWTNAYNVVTTNYDTNSSPPLLSPITNTVQIGLCALMVDARQLQSSSPVTVHDLLLHSTNIVLSDPMTVSASLLFDGQAVTLLTNLTLTGSVQDWTAANAPKLRYFTNDGFLSIPNSAHFGDDTAVPYAEFVNNGIIVSGDQTIDSLDLQINNGINYTSVGDFSATAQSIEIIGPPTFGFPYSIYSAGNINLSAGTVLIDPAALFANGALNFNVTTNLSDNGAADSFTCYNGFNLWIKPKTGDLLGSTITSIASGNFAEVDNAWAGEDRGMSLAGYTNNVAIGTLALSPQNFTNNYYPLFLFYGTTGSNAMYVGTLDLSQFTNSTELVDSIQIDPGMKIYFQYVILGFNPPPGQTPEGFLQAQFPGQIIQAPNFVAAQSGTVDWNTTYQTIDGFGASSAYNGSWTTNQADILFSTNMGVVFSDNSNNKYTNNGIGLSLLRNHIVPANNALASSTPTTAETSIMKWAQDRGARVWSTPWSPAAGFKRTNDIYDSGVATGGGINGGSFRGGNATNQAYASQLANYVASMTNNYGINLYAISIQNEPDAFVTNYDACQWSGANIHDFVTNLYNALAAKGVGSTKIILPESQNWQDYRNLAGPAMTDPNVAADVGIIADHNYDGANAPANLVKNNYGKALWETEVSQLSGENNGIGNGVYYANRIFQFLTVAQASAWHYWWIVPYGSETGLMSQNAGPTKRMFTIGQFSRFVRPGYVRIGANAGGGDLLVTAFRDPSSQNFDIVAINNNPNIDVTQTFSLTNFTVLGSVTPWITSSSQSLAAQSSVVASSGSFTYTIPAKSVVTFAGQATSVSSVRPALLPVASQTINAGVTFMVTNTATDPNVPPALAFSLLSGPTNATLGATFNNTNASFTWRPLVSQAGTTNLITVKVVDNAAQSATNSFTVIVNPLSSLPKMNSISTAGGQVSLVVYGPQGPDYTLWTSTNLVNWQALFTTNSPVPPLTLVVTNHNDGVRFYRIQIGP